MRVKEKIKDKYDFNQTYFMIQIIRTLAHWGGERGGLDKGEAERNEGIELRA